MADLSPGYVRLVDHMGTDLTVVNAARVSFSKESADFAERDRGLLLYLLEHGHTSTLRHNVLSLEIYAPLMVARQWQKYMVASAHLDDQTGWNESSRRYVTETPTFYVPQADSWRSAPESRKQGSGPPVSDEIGLQWTETLQSWVEEGVALYDAAMAAGICAEQARLFLPAYGMFVRWRWTVSLGALINFLDQRLASDAQDEFTEYAYHVKEIATQLWPEVMAAWRDW